MDARVRTVSLVVTIDRLFSKLHNKFAAVPEKGILKLIRRHSVREGILLSKDWVSPDGQMYLRSLVIRPSVNTDTRKEIVRLAREEIVALGGTGGDHMCITVGHLRVVVDFIFEGSDTAIAMVVKTAK